MHRLQAGALGLTIALVLGGCQPAAKDGASASAPAAGAAPAAAAGPAMPLEATAAGGPKRADGFWEFSWGDAKQQYCVGNGSEEKFSLVDELSVLGDCSKKDFKRIANGWEFVTVCEMMGTTTTQKGTITGDFRTNYRIDQEVSRSPGGSIKGEIIAHRVGDCPAPYKGGDMVKGDLVINMAK